MAKRRAKSVGLDIRSFNPAFIRLAGLSFIRELESNGYIVSPSQSLRVFEVTSDCPPKPANHLTVGENDRFDFIRRKCSNDEAFLEYLKRSFKDFFHSIEQDSESFKSFWNLEMRCWANIAAALSVHGNTKINTESELRYCVGDPLVTFLSELGNYHVHFEVSVQKSHAEFESNPEEQEDLPESIAKVPKRATRATPGSQKATAAISGGSIADYVCFTLRKPGSDEVVAIIIETKMDKISHHAVAQAVGYYMMFTVPHPSNLVPLVIVLTEEKIHLLLFPFQKSAYPLVNALEICLLLWSEVEKVEGLPLPRLFNMKTLHILSSFVLAQCRSQKLTLEYTFDDAVEKGTLWTKIVPSEHQQLEEMKAKVEELRAELEELRKENKENK